MDRLSDSRSVGSGRSKKRLPLPSERNNDVDGDLLSIISGDSKKSSRLPLPSGEGEMDLLSHFSSDQKTETLSKSSRGSKRKNLPLPSRGGDSLDLLSSLTSSNYDNDRKSQKSNSKKSSASRKKLPLPSQMDSNDLIANFLEPSSDNILDNKKKLAPKFGRQTLADEGSEMELLERLSNFSSQSSKSKRNLPRPSEMKNTGTDDLLSLIQNDGDSRSLNGNHESVDGENQSENIVYDPVDSEDVDEEYLTSPKDNIKEAIDVLSLLSGQEGGIKPRVLTHRGKYSDEGSSEVHSEASNDRAESKVSGLGYVSDRSTSTGMSERRREKALDSLNQVQDGKQWNQNRAYFLRTAKMREKKANSPLSKWLPGGSMSSASDRVEPTPDTPETVQENEMIEQLQLELEEARRTIRQHESKILHLQDEVEAARESCIEEECERVEAEIAKERVHNENRMLKIQLKEIEDQSKVAPLADLSSGRARSVELVDSIEIQTDESFLRTCKSAADMYDTHQPRKLNDKKLYTKETIEELASDRSFHSDLDQADGLLIPIKSSSTQNQIAIPFRQRNRSYKMELVAQWFKAILHDDFSCSLYKT